VVLKPIGNRNEAKSMKYISEKENKRTYKNDIL
jgi:hypothetical protein